MIVIEHNLDVIKTADWILDLGPEGGDRGGEVIAQGPPERVAKAPGSYTGHFLAGSLGLEAERDEGADGGAVEAATTSGGKPNEAAPRAGSARATKGTRVAKGPAAAG